MTKASEAGGQLVPDPHVLFVAHEMFVLQEKEKGPSGEKGKKHRNQKGLVTYRATRVTFREIVQLGKDRGHTVPMFLPMDQVDDLLEHFSG